MPDVNYAHRFLRNSNGVCKEMVGSRKQGFELCHLPEDAVVHKRYEPPCKDHWHRNVVLLNIRDLSWGFFVTYKCNDCGREFENAKPF